MRSIVLPLAASFFLAGCGGPPASDGPEAMGRHFVSLLDSDIEAAVTYVADNWWKDGPLEPETRRKLIKELAEFIKQDNVKKYTFSEIEIEGTQATGWFRKLQEDGNTGEETFRMTLQDGRWWFCE